MQRLFCDDFWLWTSVLGDPSTQVRAARLVSHLADTFRFNGTKRAGGSSPALRTLANCALCVAAPTRCFWRRTTTKRYNSACSCDQSKKFASFGQRCSGHIRRPLEIPPCITFKYMCIANVFIILATWFIADSKMSDDHAGAATCLFTYYDFHLPSKSILPRSCWY